ELLEWLQALRHSMLRVEVLVARERHEIARRPAVPDAIRRFGVHAAQRLGDVGSDTSRPAHTVVEPGGIADAHVCELSAQLQPIAPVAAVHFADRHRCVQPGRGEARFARPEARPYGQAAPAKVFETAGIRDIADVRLGSLLPAAPNTFAGGEFQGIERGNDVRAIAKPLTESAVNASTDIEPRARNDHGVDEGALDAIEHGRLVAFVDDAYGHQQHA